MALSLPSPCPEAWSKGFQKAGSEEVCETGEVVACPPCPPRLRVLCRLPCATLAVCRPAPVFSRHAPVAAA